MAAVEARCLDAMQKNYFPIILTTGVRVTACCATSVLAIVGKNVWERCYYTCPEHQESCYHQSPQATSYQELPGSRNALKADELVALAISPPHDQYQDGLLVTGHRGIQVQRSIQDRHADAHSPEQDQKPAPPANLPVLLSEESQRSSLHRSAEESKRRDEEEGEDEMEVGKISSNDVRLFTCQSSAVFLHFNTDFDCMVLPNDRYQ